MPGLLTERLSAVEALAVAPDIDVNVWANDAEAVSVPSNPIEAV
jgi:hypothetical protein